MKTNNEYTFLILIYTRDRKEVLLCTTITTNKNMPSLAPSTHKLLYVIFIIIIVFTTFLITTTTGELYCPGNEHDMNDESVYSDHVKFINGGWTIRGDSRVSSKTSFNLLGGYIAFNMDVTQVSPEVNTIDKYYFFFKTTSLFHPFPATIAGTYLRSAIKAK